eukprot:Tbor_TRINITY_DN432_c0_g1::TRINITY_DN432_c0_g1_i1::g.3214::m.3214
MFRRGVLNHCQSYGQKLNANPPTTISKNNKGKTTPPSPVLVRSLYHSLLKEVRALDKRPIMKVLFPISNKLQEVTGLHSPLYTPNGPSYETIVKKLFRLENGASSSNSSLIIPLEVGFEALNRLKLHNDAVGEQLPNITKDHAKLVCVMDNISNDSLQSLFWAKPIPVTTSPTIPFLEGKSNKSSTKRVDVKDMSSRSLLPAIRRAEIIKTNNEVKCSVTKPFEVEVGMGLIAHPLSSSHVDRRVMVVVEKTSHVTTAIVLDMLYSYPLSHGNPMFPEVFWGHEVFNGGYCHVDYTMPPTANVAILHTLEPSKDTSSPQYGLWQKWVSKGGPSAAGITDTEPNDVKEKCGPTRHHELLCKPVVRRQTLDDGTVSPTLYYSKAEALPYLATLCPGALRSSVRVYWGVMKWPTSQINAEVINGHWMPVEMSANFFGAYVFTQPKTGTPGSKLAKDTDAPINSKEKRSQSDITVSVEERFPTIQDLEDNAEQRMKVLGANVVIPQTFPPNQPMCRREVLWDQLLYSLGGEYRALVGTTNPFTSPKNTYDRAQSADIPIGLLEGVYMNDNDDDDD